MKHYHACRLTTICLTLLLLLLPQIAIGETVPDILPDASVWGISRTKFKQTYGSYFQDIELEGFSSLWEQNVEIDGYLGNIYYVFSTPHGNYNGLGKIVFLQDISGNVTYSTVKKCYAALVEDLTNYDQPEEPEKNVSRWRYNDCTIEINIGNYPQYNDSDSKATAIIITPADNTNQTSSSQSKLSAKMTVNASASCSDYNHVGNEWSQDYYINGEKVSRQSQITLSAGDEVTVMATITESDKAPDVGSTKMSHTVTQSELDNGFTISFNVQVRENKGRYSGSVAVWSVNFRFSR